MFWLLTKTLRFFNKIGYFKKDNKMNELSVITVLFNEEHRIERLLNSLRWCKEVIVVDKSSTDNTVQIARSYSNVKIINVPYSDTGPEVQIGVNAASNLWVLHLTASDIIHPKLVDELLLLINKPDFDYDIIDVPFAMYVFGIRSRRSPWHIKTKQWMFKKTVLQARNEVHNEVCLVSKKHYKLKLANENYAIHHLTHQTLDSFIERHMRYCRAETNKYSDETKAFKEISKEIWRAFKSVFFKRKTWLLGWDGFALGIAYISYYIFKFLFVWQKFRATGEKKYSELEQNIFAESNI